MKVMIPAFLGVLLLVGCGKSPQPTMPQLTSQGTFSSRSDAGLEKGMQAMFDSWFKRLDRDGNQVLSAREYEEAGSVFLPGFEALDQNRDKKLEFKEFKRPDLVQWMTAMIREEAKTLFAKLDANGDRNLVPAELKHETIRFTFKEADRNSDGKLTLSELEDALAKQLGDRI